MLTRVYQLQGAGRAMTDWRSFCAPIRESRVFDCTVIDVFLFYLFHRVASLLSILLVHHRDSRYGSVPSRLWFWRTGCCGFIVFFSRGPGLERIKWENNNGRPRNNRMSAQEGVKGGRDKRLRVLRAFVCIKDVESLVC